MKDQIYGKIDEEYGVPVDSIRCPGCGRTYKQKRKGCLHCEECHSCCTCKEPKIVTARQLIASVLDLVGEDTGE